MTQMPADTVDAGLMDMLKQDVAELPPHIQKAVKEKQVKEGAKDGAWATKDLHAAATHTHTHLGHMQKAYEKAILARSQLHSNWKKFLSDAVKLWQDYATQFAVQEQRLQLQVVSEKEAFLTAKEASAKAHEIAGEVQEIKSDEEYREVAPSTTTSTQRITESIEGLSKSLESLQQQAAAIPKEEVHLAKRPHTRHPNEEMRTCRRLPKKKKKDLLERILVRLVECDIHVHQPEAH